MHIAEAIRKPRGTATEKQQRKSLSKILGKMEEVKDRSKYQRKMRAITEQIRLKQDMIY